MTARVEHIVWDWNGTLFADGAAMIDATIDAFAACGLGVVSRADCRRWFRQPIAEYYDSLAGRPLLPAELQALVTEYRAAYHRRRDSFGLTADAACTLDEWQELGGSQSLLSMYPHDRLLPLVRDLGISRYFRRIDGLVGTDSASKAPHLRRHLDLLGAPAEQVLLVGDSVDDAKAAAACGVGCVLFHAGADALHEQSHFTALDVPVVHSLREAIALAAAPRA